MMRKIKSSNELKAIQRQIIDAKKNKVLNQYRKKT